MKKTLIITLMFSFTILAQETVQFIIIGDGGVSKVSDNGTFVCGNNYPQPGFLWNENSGRINLGSGYTEGYAVSDNGIVAGRYLDTTLINPGSNSTYRAGYFNGSGWMPLDGYAGYPPLDEQSYTHAYGISADGSMIVGMQWTPTWRAEACYWQNGIIHLLGRTGGQSSRANDVAVNGSDFIIAGWDGDSNGPDRRAFYWDPLPHFIGGYDTTYLVGECRGLNSDGSKIVGGSAGVPFVWSQTGGMQWITTAYYNQGGEAIDISDNDIIVGYVDPGGFNYQAFIKKPEWNNIVFFKSYLIDSLNIQGISDWYFPFLNSISADGRVMGGTAYPPSGGPTAFVVKFNDPLPVELTSFTGLFENGKIKLNWITKSEINNQGFEIQKSPDNLSWIKTGFVNGNGTTTEKKQYYFVDDPEGQNNTVYYRIKQIDFDGSFKYSETVSIEIINAVTTFSLEQNYPNPFNPETTIKFNVPETSHIKLTVLNALGEKISDLVNEVKVPGSYIVNFNASNLSSGVYLYRIESLGHSFTRKMLLMK